MAEKVNAQRLELGRPEVMGIREGGAMVSFGTEDAGFEKAHVTPILDRFSREAFSRRLWEKDGSLWKGDDAIQAQITDSLGWLDLPSIMEGRIPEIEAFVREAQDAGFTHVVHMGMGGSSLAPLVFQRLFCPGPRGLSLLVLDSTDPYTVATLEQTVPLPTTLFVVASKSGTTAEPSAFGDYFYERLRSLKGQKAGENFVAITDPGTVLADQAKERGFRKTFLNFSDVGGRYSALSYVGLVPGALMGLDVKALVGRAAAMAKACGPAVREAANPGIVLGTVVGAMARMGRDKLTFLMSPELSSLGMWLEQLIAESTGKEGKGILPVVGEEAGDPEVYGDDRLFVYIYEKGSVDSAVEEGVRKLRMAKLPVIVIEIIDRTAIIQEFFRWEIATATAGAVLGINPFDQPNVQEAKDATKRLLKRVEEEGALTEPAATATHGALGIFLRNGASDANVLLEDFLSQGRPGDYVSLHAYIPEEAHTASIIESIRLRLRDALQLATTVGYGPRLLHSTGQLHKGGANNGLFIQLTARDSLDISIPGKPYTFGIFKRAQALGDFEALVRHGRRVLRVDLGDDPRKGLTQFRSLIEGTVPKGALA